MEKERRGVLELLLQKTYEVYKNAVHPVHLAHPNSVARMGVKLGTDGRGWAYAICPTVAISVSKFVFLR